MTGKDDNNTTGNIYINGVRYPKPAGNKSISVSCTTKGLTIGNLRAEGDIIMDGNGIHFTTEDTPNNVQRGETLNQTFNLDGYGTIHRNFGNVHTTIRTSSSSSSSSGTKDNIKSNHTNNEYFDGSMEGGVNNGIISGNMNGGINKGTVQGNMNGGTNEGTVQGNMNGGTNNGVIMGNMYGGTNNGTVMGKHIQ